MIQAIQPQNAHVYYLTNLTECRSPVLDHYSVPFLSCRMKDYFISWFQNLEHGKYDVLIEDHYELMSHCDKLFATIFFFCSICYPPQWIRRSDYGTWKVKFV